jgi:hypothetical protein
MDGIDYRQYARRIKKKLMEDNPEKYRYVSIKALTKHTKHIGWCLAQIVLTHNDGFESPYFTLHRGFKKYLHAKHYAQRYKIAIEDEKRLALEQENTKKERIEGLGLRRELQKWADSFIRRSHR